MSDRFWSKVDKTPTCWLWTRHTDRGGYGRFNIDGSPRLAHRVAYQLLVGPIPDGLDLDHLCRVRNCVNPTHLEPVTRAENLRRSDAPNFVTVRTNACHRGHELTPANTYVRKDNGRRRCRACYLVKPLIDVEEQP